MQLIWHGQACFQLELGRQKEEKVLIVIDPFSEEIGFKLPKMEADILLVTHDHYDHANIKGVSGNPFLINSPGEYEIKGVFIQGIEAWHDKAHGKERGRVTIFTIEGEDLRICHLGDFGQRELTEEQVERIGDIDILMIPVGGVFTISAQEASRVISQIEPRICLPMHYQLPKLKIKLEGLDKFLKVMGVRNPEMLNKLTVKKRDLPSEGMKIYTLKP